MDELLGRGEEPLGTVVVEAVGPRVTPADRAEVDALGAGRLEIADFVANIDGLVGAEAAGA